MSRNFYKFVVQNCHDFLPRHDYQYVIVPLSSLPEFYRFVLEPNVVPIYYEKGNYHFIDPPMKPEFQRFCQEQALRQETMTCHVFSQPEKK